MTKAFHYMKDYSWNCIRGTNIREPVRAKSTFPDQSVVDLTGVKNVPGKFLFCFLDSPKPEAWVNNGALDHLIQTYLENKFALLSFEVLPSDRAFVVDSTKFYEFWAEMHGNWRNIAYNDQNYERFVKITRDYVSSKIPLRAYTGNFKMPELLIANDIPRSRIILEAEVDGEPSYEYRKKLGKSKPVS